MIKFGITPYSIQGTNIDLFSSETSYGIMTVAEVNFRYHYLGTIPNNISTAIALFERINDYILTKVEIDAVLIENGLKLLSESFE